uniref:Portal protein n=1 Tax=viral metagenome TaxID=1070528 RepID=A0A6M3J1Y5_9ZZZZ
MVDSAKDVVKLLKDVKGFYIERDKQHNEQWAIYNGDLKWYVIEGVEEKHIPTTAAGKIDNTCNHILSLVVECISPPHKDGEQAQRQARKRSSLINWVFDESDRLSEIPTRGSALKNLVIFGESYLKGAYFNPDILGSEPTIRDGEDEDDFDFRYASWEMRCKRFCPISISAVSPLAMYPDPSPSMSFGMETYERRVMSIRNDFPYFDSWGSLKNTDKVTWVEYADAGKRIYFIYDSTIERALVIPPHPDLPEDYKMGDFIRNVYEYVPYVRMYSGLGTQTKNGLPEEKAIGFLKRAKSALTAEARLETALNIMIEQNVFRPYKVLLGQEMKPEDVDMTWRPGSRIDIPPGADVQPIEPVRIEPAAFQHLANIKEEINMVTTPPSMQGLRQRGVYYGYQEAVLIGQGGTAFVPIITPFLNGVATMGGMILQTLEKVVKGTLHDCEPKDIKGFYEVFAKVDAKTVEEKDRRFKLGIEASTILPLKYIYGEFLDVEKPDEVLAQMDAERQIKAGNFDDIMRDAVIKGWGVEQIRAMVEERVKGGASQQTAMPNVEIPTQQRLGALPSPLRSRPESEIAPRFRGQI